MSGNDIGMHDLPVSVHNLGEVIESTHVPSKRQCIRELESTLIYQPELELSSNGTGLFECQGYFVHNVKETASATCGQQHVASTSMNNGGPPPEYKHIGSCCHSFQDSAMKRQACCDNRDLARLV
ncbi:hypothetical protein Tco_1436423 [Tanacetum coccineum]